MSDAGESPALRSEKRTKGRQFPFAFFSASQRLCASQELLAQRRGDADGEGKEKNVKANLLNLRFLGNTFRKLGLFLCRNYKLGLLILIPIFAVPLIYLTFCFRFYLDTEKCPNSVEVVSKSDRAYIFVQWESDDRSGTLSEIVKCNILIIPWNLDDVRVHSRVPIFSYSLSDGEALRDVQLSDSRLGPVWGIGKNTIFLEQSKRCFGWNGRAIVPIKPAAGSSTPVQVHSNDINELKDHGWSLIESDLDPRLMFDTNGDRHPLHLRVGKNAIDVYISSGTRNRIQKSVKITLNDVVKFHFPN